MVHETNSISVHGYLYIMKGSAVNSLRISHKIGSIARVHVLGSYNEWHYSKISIIQQGKILLQQVQ